MATPGANSTTNQSVRWMRCARVRSSRCSIRLTALLLTPKLARVVTTPIFTSSVIRLCSTRLIIMNLDAAPPVATMIPTPVFELFQAAEAHFPTEYGLFRIYGFEGRAAGQVEEAVVLR